MPFSEEMTQWLSHYDHWIGDFFSYSIPHDLAGRSLGPASGLILPCYPFLQPCALTGVFAGLTVSTWEPLSHAPEILSYRSPYGFPPVLDGPAAGTGWQLLSGQDWRQIVPTDFTLDPDVPPRPYRADLTLLWDGQEIETQSWHYRSQIISPCYLSHTWVEPDATKRSTLIHAITFRAVREDYAPFLRPYFIEGRGILDPQCCGNYPKKFRCYQGILILQSRPEVQFDVIASETEEENEDSAAAQKEITVIRVSAPRSQYQGTNVPIGSMSGVKPDERGNLSLVSNGAHNLSCDFTLFDTETNEVTLEKGALMISTQTAPCCSCDDFIAAYEKLRQIRDQIAEMQEKHNDAVARLIEEREALEKDVTQKTRLVSFIAEIEHKVFDVIEKTPVARSYSVPSVKIRIRCLNPYRKPLVIENYRIRLESEETETAKFVRMIRLEKIEGFWGEEDQIGKEEPHPAEDGHTEWEASKQWINYLLGPITVPPLSIKSLLLTFLLWDYRGMSDWDGQFLEEWVDANPLLWIVEKI